MARAQDQRGSTIGEALAGLPVATIAVATLLFLADALPPKELCNNARLASPRRVGDHTSAWQFHRIGASERLACKEDWPHAHRAGGNSLHVRHPTDRGELVWIKYGRSFGGCSTDGSLLRGDGAGRRWASSGSVQKSPYSSCCASRGGPIQCVGDGLWTTSREVTSAKGKLGQHEPIEAAHRLVEHEKKSDAITLCKRDNKDAKQTVS